MSSRRLTTAQTTYHTFAQVQGQGGKYGFGNKRAPIVSPHKGASSLINRMSERFGKTLGIRTDRDVSGIPNTGCTSPGSPHPLPVIPEKKDFGGVRDLDEPWSEQILSVKKHSWLENWNLQNQWIDVDRGLRLRTILIFANALFGLLIMVLILLICWDGDDCRPTLLTTTLRYFISGSTLVLVWQILDRKRLELESRNLTRHRKKHKTGNAISRDETRPLLRADPPKFSPATSIASTLIVAGSKCWTQILVCLFHPLPSFSEEPLFVDEWGLLMFLRLAFVLPVIRDFSPIYKNRRAIQRDSIGSRALPEFDEWLALKTLAYQWPFCFIFACSGSAVLIFGFCIYSLERNAQPEVFDLSGSFFLAFESMFTGWPCDIYDYYDPISWGGRFSSILASLCGLFLTTFTIGLISQWLIPTRFEESALHWMMHKKWREEEADAAARLIQFTWRNYLHECKLEKELAEKDPAKYEEISAEEGKEFLRHFWRYARVFRRANRHRIETEEQMNPIGKQNLEPADLMKFAKLEELKIEMVNAQMRTDTSLRRLEKLLMTAINVGAGNIDASISKATTPSPININSSRSKSTSSAPDTLLSKSSKLQEMS